MSVIPAAEIKRPLPTPASAPLRPLARFRAWMNMLWLDHSIFRFFFNLRSRVAPGVYRSSHPMPYQLRAAAAAGIRTVLNLRGIESHIGSNQLEWDTCQRLGLRVVHFPLGSRDAPERGEVLGLQALFETLERPLLLHCKSGADRAGFVSALYLLMHEGQPLEVAERQLRFWPHGHIRQANTGILDHFFDCYRVERDRDGIAFIDWVRQRYDRDAVRLSFRANWWAAQLVDRVLRRE